MRSEDGRPVLCPAARGAFFSRHHLRQSVSCLSSIENTAPSLTSTFRTMPNAADLIGELHVIAPGLEARDAQALVVVDGSIATILALVGAHLSVPAGDIWKVVIV
jgi:hypothetical protein